MDREILFRGKRADGNNHDGEWIYGYGATGDRIIHLDIYAGFVGVTVDPSTIGQYTGLTDKNGVKIFEGDIFKLQYPNCAAVVTWDAENGRFLGFTTGNEKRIVYVGRTPSPIEVIGNIHDNQDLMGDEDDG